MPFSNPSPRELAADAIAVKIHWFGLILGYLYVNFGSPSPHLGVLNAILGLGVVYTVLDTVSSWRLRVFLHDLPLVISVLEALFIGLLSYFDRDPQSPFRFFYLLSLICSAIRHSKRVTWITCGLDCLSYGLLSLAQLGEMDLKFSSLLLPVVLIWATWAASSLTGLLKESGDGLIQLNAALRENQAQLESRIEERTRELQETQAQLMHQEKMAGFGLLAAGIAHEVGNPLTSISTLVQMLERRDLDAYTREKLSLVAGQLTRIQAILRELVTFSRPANPDQTRFTVPEIVEEALGIAKYYKGTKSRSIISEVPEGLPVLHGLRDQIVQVIFNLVLNAIDATAKGGVISLVARRVEGSVEIEVKDNGAGIAEEHRKKIFQPYFTTKKQGTGLGLFVSSKLIQQHGGRMEFESQPGQGTLFRMRLPAAV